LSPAGLKRLLIYLICVSTREKEREREREGSAAGVAPPAWMDGGLRVKEKERDSAPVKQTEIEYVAFYQDVHSVYILS